MVPDVDRAARPSERKAVKEPKRKYGANPATGDCVTGILYTEDHP
jgi:hypothetical protein